MQYFTSCTCGGEDRIADGALPEDLAIETASTELITSMDKVMSLEMTKDKSLQEFSERSRQYAQEILVVVGKGHIGDQSSKWMVLKKSVRRVWIEGDVKRMQENLSHSGDIIGLPIF